MFLKFKKLHKDAKWKIGTEKSEGIDLASVINKTMFPGEIHKIPLGISVEPPEGYYTELHLRSSLRVEGLLSMVSIIDNDYRGELMLIIVCTVKKYYITKGDFVGQLLIKNSESAKFKIMETDTLSETPRGSGGFGSTNK